MNLFGKPIGLALTDVSMYTIQKPGLLLHFLSEIGFSNMLYAT
jgi:hypothetical protein